MVYRMVFDLILYSCHMDYAADWHCGLTCVIMAFSELLYNEMVIQFTEFILKHIFIFTKNGTVIICIINNVIVNVNMLCISSAVHGIDVYDL